MTVSTLSQDHAPLLSNEAAAVMYASAIEAHRRRSSLPDHPALESAHKAGFFIVEPIGTGGICDVWRGIDENTGQDVAIKVVREPEHADADRRARVLEQEAQTLAQLPAGCGPTLVRRGGGGRELFVAMSYFEGVTLDHQDWATISKQGMLDTLRQLVRLVRQLHERGIAHGDIKPSNILLDAKGHPHLIDFGFAGPMHEPHQSLLNSRVEGGTQPFLPPSGRAGHPRQYLDRYALGRTLADVGGRSCVSAASRKLSGASRRLMQADVSVPSIALLREVEETLASRPTVRRSLLAAAVLTMLLAPLAMVHFARQDLGGQVDSASVASAGLRWAGLQGQVRGADVAQARAALLDIEATDRNWAWRHLWLNATEPPAEEHLLFPIKNVSDSTGLTDGQVAVGTFDGHITLMHREEIRWTVQPFQTEVRHLVLHPPSQRIAACDRLGNIVILSSDGDIVASFALPKGRTACLAWIDADTLHVTSVDNELWSVSADGETQQRIGQWDLILLPTTSIGHYLTATATDRGLDATVHDRSGRARWQVELPPGQTPLCFDVHAASGRAAIGLTQGDLILGSLEEPGNTRVAVPDEIYIGTLAFDPEGGVVAVAGGAVTVIDTVRGEAVMQLATNLSGLVSGLRWDPWGQSFSLQTSEGVSWWRSKAIPILASR